MTASAALLGAIFQITRGDLEDAQLPFAPPGRYLGNLAAVRISRLSEFWNTDRIDGTNALLHSTENLIRGFFGRKCAWTFALSGRGSNIQCWFGTRPDELDRDSLEALVRSSFPDARIPAERLEPACLDGEWHGVVVTGTPSAKSRLDDTCRRDPLGQLCRALLGHRWLYLVSASPLAPADTIRRINAVTDAIRDTRASHLLKDSPIDDENRTALRYIALLESKLKRLEAGRLSGMWDVRCACYAETQGLADRARHVLESGYSGAESLPDPVRVRPFGATPHGSPALEPLTTAEAAALAQMPREEFPGLEMVEPARFGVQPPRTTRGDAVQIGEIVDRGTHTGNRLLLDRNDLTKHGLIAGITGSGKTNSCQWLLDQVWNDGRGAPFLVIESAKSEYRNLLLNRRFHGLTVFTVGDETVSPLRLNPFEVPAGVLVQTHIDYVKTLFAAAFVLYPPMPYVLEQAVQEIYQDRGWDVARNTNSRGLESRRSAPMLDDLAAKIPVVVDRMGYDQRISMDVTAGLLARIDQLRRAGGKGRMLNTRVSVDPARLFERPCLLELKQLVSDDEKAFVIGLVLIRLYEHHESRRERGSGLVHLTLIEEAHRLLRNVSTDQSSDVSANPRGRAVEVFANILSEVRAFGESIVVAEQVPAKLTPDVVKNTGFKLIHRLVSPDDRSAVGGAVNLDAPQLRRLATLATGEGVAWTERTAKAVLVQVPPSQVSEAGSVSDDALRAQARAGGAVDNVSLLPFDACRDCPGSAPGSCRSLPRDRWDPVLVLAFRRAFNAVRQFGAAMTPTFAEFRHLVRRQGRASDPSHPFCTFIALAESEIERRGEFMGWRFADVDAVIASLGGIARIIFAALDGDVSPVVPDGNLLAFQARCRELHRIDALPYPGCRHCASPCNFRFDMARVEPQASRDFRRAFLDVEVATERLSHLARSVATRSFFISDAASCASSAFCFSVQELASPSLGLATYHQLQMATQLQRQLA